VSKHQTLEDRHLSMVNSLETAVVSANGQISLPF